MRHALILSAVLLALAASGDARAQPVLRSITVDGDLSDWTEILASPDNVARDGDGSTVACPDSTDADCPVATRAADLLRFAWTADDLFWFFCFDRPAGSATQDRDLYVYFDTDHDRLMERGEPVLHYEVRADGGNADSNLYDYVPADPAGDPLEDASGRADGWTLPGSLQIVSSGNVSPSGGIAPDGTRGEGGIRWARLRIPPGAPMRFHVSLARGRNVPGDIDDNMGGPLGAGDTGFRAVALDGPFNAAGEPGTTVTIAHRVTAAGNLPSRLLLRATSSSGLMLTWRRDVDGNGIAETLLGIDASGDGVFGGAGDSLTFEGDGDGDGVLDSGILGAGSQASLEIGAALPPSALGLRETITVETWALEDDTLRASVTDVVRGGEVTIARDEARQAAAGETAWLPHVVSENSGRARVTGLTSFSSRGWRWSWWQDPNGDGNPADALPLTDTDGDGRTDVTLAPFQAVRVFAAAEIPGGTLTGIVDTATMRVHDGAQIVSTVTNRVLVGPALDLAPSWLLADGRARYSGAGEAVYFPHRLTNGSGRLTEFTLAASCDTGWPVLLMLDPDCDGRPGDAIPLPSSRVTVPVSGGELAMMVRVSVPASGRVSDIGTITFTATATADARVTSTVTDQAVVALIRTYDDPAAVAGVGLVRECSDVIAVATGLVPSEAHRVTWRDASGASLRLQAVTTDPSGRCSDTLTLAPGWRGGGFSVDVEGWSGTAWVMLDTAPFAVGDELEGSLDLGTPRADVASGRVSASLFLFNASFDQSVTAAEILFRLLSPDGATILDESGAFVPFTGTEVTSRRTASLAPRDWMAVPISLSDLVFPSIGDWRVEALRTGDCGMNALLGSGMVTVADDADLDGLTGPAEIALGTDPGDADSDDDGLSDLEEGAGDADADGVIDALQCDADGDGLPDGLESGVPSPPPGTDIAAGCFRPDDDPSTVTDPRAADTDGGGVPDGVEDIDGDGMLDAGEADPALGADDVFVDRDTDGLPWVDEQAQGTSDADGDMDDDGLLDGQDGVGDSDGDGVPDLRDCDSDDDGLLDGLETGIVTPGPGTDVAAGCFRADADPVTVSDPDARDSDAGGVDDGVEDRNADGRLDAYETLPGDAADDFPACSRSLPAPASGLRVTRQAGDAVLSWTDPLDPCVLHVVQSTETLPAMTDATTVAGLTWTDARPLAGALVRYYVVLAESFLAGREP